MVVDKAITAALNSTVILLQKRIRREKRFDRQEQWQKLAAVHRSARKNKRVETAMCDLKRGI